MAAIKNSFQRSVQWSPAIHREQPVGRLRGGCARRACGVSCTLFVDGASSRAMASTRVMVPKDCNHSGRWRAAHLPAHQRGRWMDGTLQARGPSHGRALQLQRWPMRFICAPACWPQMSRSRQPSLCSPGPREGPRGRTMESERFVADSSLPLMEPPVNRSIVRTIDLLTFFRSTVRTL